jgi:L-lactate dehydrogenase complex protein LldF
MNSNSEIFIEEANKKAFDLEHRRKINNNIGKYNVNVQNGKSQFADHELGRTRASFIKYQTLENLDKYLIEFESNFTKNGGKVIWAKNIEDAQDQLLSIFNKHHAKTTVKAKSMTTEEIHMNEFLTENNVEVIETDLGEYIVQLAGQKPYHIVTPAMHMSKKDVSDLFVKKLNIPYTDDAQELTMTARRILRNKYTSADIGISGGNFLIADIGGIAVTENEGNARLCTTFPKVHIAIVGIEKMIPAMEDLALFWPMLAHSGSGQQVTVYNTIFTGPRKPGETDGPKEMYVILLDNGRTNLLADVEKRQALSCIRCGACLNICPVYKNIGGHTYKSTYSGPIGSVITPHYEGMKEFKHLSFASSLCGACTTVCPVKIDLHNLLLLNRNQSVKEGLTTKSEKFGFRIWKKAMKKRSMMNLIGSGMKNFLIGFLFKESWGRRRKTPTLAPRSFNQLWRDKYLKK